jgi:GNAT superfamily N-acetyltransferase
MITTRLFRPRDLSQSFKAQVPALRALEASITYPLDDGQDAFSLDHGAAYHPFFSRQGDAYFLCAFDGMNGPLVGSGVGIFKPVALDGAAFPSVYLCDVKVAASHRGRGLSHRLHGEALARALVTPELRRFRLVWGVAMRGARGDVRRSWTGNHVARLAAPLGELAIYFADPRRLALLDVTSCPPVPQRGVLDLSPLTSSGSPLLVSTAGQKDLRVVSTGSPLPLLHFPLNPAFARPSYGHALRAAALAALAPSSESSARPPTHTDTHTGALVCFSLDTRLAPLIGWLRAQGIVSTTGATVLGLSLPGSRRGLVHLATSDI